VAKQNNKLSLARLAPFDDGDLRIVVETPKGSRNKYDYDSEAGYFELAAVLPEGMIFPFDFGFVPSTRGEDGDPLDALVLVDAPVAPGLVVRSRLIGALLAKQKNEGSDWIRNDRFIAVATHARTLAEIANVSELRPNVVKDIKAFFVDYNKLRGRKFEPIDVCGPKKALKLINEGLAARKNGARSKR
jgi:inorganic pyrophosphatase